MIKSHLDFKYAMLALKIESMNTSSLLLHATFHKLYYM